MLKRSRYLLVVLITLLAANLLVMVAGSRFKAQANSGRFKVVVFQANQNPKEVLEKELNDPYGQWSSVSVHLAQHSGDNSLAILRK